MERYLRRGFTVNAIGVLFLLFFYNTYLDNVYGLEYTGAVTVTCHFD